MPITRQSLNFIFDSMACWTHEGEMKLAMCELGNQLLSTELQKEWGHRTAKEYFESKGITHLSIDINGEDKSIKLDLSKDLYGSGVTIKSAVITNMGTSEHVEDQYNCFLNIHNLCVKNGLMIHAVPLIGHWKGHCNYHYTNNFFTELEKRALYEHVIGRIQNVSSPMTNNIYCAMKKVEDNKFMDRDAFDKIWLSSDCTG